MRSVVVKFTYSYSKDGHELLASVGLAPKLWFCERCEDVNGLCVVIMDYIHAEKLPTRAVPDTVVAALRLAIQKLHANDLVLGDFRRPNVLVTGDSVMLVDFDWCGKEGEARYPSDVNLSDGSIGWHDGVRRGGLIEKEHDIHFFKMMTGQDFV